MVGTVSGLKSSIGICWTQMLHLNLLGSSAFVAAVGCIGDELGMLEVAMASSVEGSLARRPSEVVFGNICCHRMLQRVY